MDKLLVKFKWDCGRQGKVTSIFICVQEDLDKIIGKRIYFGEILGKHSEICGKLEAEEFVIKSKDQDFINKLEEVFESETISGHNPLNYFDEEYANK